MTIAGDLAAYAADLEYGDLDERTVDRVKVQLLDTLSCAVGALDERAVERVRAYALDRSSSSEATVVGTDETAPPEYAAMANGAAIRYLDWNDTGISTEVGCGHPSDNFATVLAAAEAHDRGGEAVILATVLAYEVHVRLCDAIPLRRHGWDHVVYNVVAGALAAGKLAGLDREELEQAVDVALAGHLATYQSRTGELSDWKGLAAANAARNAVVCADLAARGITGPNEIFEGKHGLLAHLPEEADVDASAFGGPETPFKIDTATFCKVYPIETHSQAAVECVRKLRAEHDVTSEEIQSITCETYESAVGEIGDDSKWDPRTRGTADHSLPYVVARAFLDGTIGPDQFRREQLTDPTVRDLMSTVSVEENEQFTELYGDAMPHAITVETDRGTFSARVDRPKGHWDRPFSMADVAEKFERAAPASLQAADREFVRERVERLEELDSLTSLYRPLA